MAPAETVAALRVEVVYCPAPGQVDQTSLALPAGSRVADALRDSGVLARHPEWAAGGAEPRVGVWCHVVPTDTPLRDLDRVELYRPLKVDPKEARRLRYRRRAR